MTNSVGLPGSDHENFFRPDWHIVEEVICVPGSGRILLISNGSVLPQLRLSDLDVPIPRIESPPEDVHEALLDYLSCRYRNGVQSRLIYDIGSQLYGFKAKSQSWLKGQFRKRGIIKNKTSNIPKSRQRSCQNLKRPPRKVPLAIVQKNFNFLFRNIPGQTASPGKYRPQEQILYNLDCFIHGIFDRRNCNGKWRADLVQFIHPDKDSLLKRWQYLSDEAYGVAAAIRSLTIYQASGALNKLLSNIKETASMPDPSFLTKFWKICLQIRAIDCRVPHFDALQRLFSGLEQTFSENAGNHRALLGLMRSLRQVAPEDMKCTLRLGFNKTLSTVESLIGDENAIVMHMWSQYFRYWDRKRLFWDALTLKFDFLWHKIHSQHAPESSLIAISYYYTYSIHYLGKTRALSDGMIRNLYSRPAMYLKSQQDIQWGLPALAFSFSDRIQAQTYRDLGHVEWCINTMDYAILLLERGDKQCCIRAVMLCEILIRWLKGWERHDEADSRLGILISIKLDLA